MNRLEPGVIRHVAHGTIVLGEHERPPEPRTQAIAAMIRNSGVPCKVTDDLARSHWEKLVWNIPFNGLGVASAAGFESVRAGMPPPRAALRECLTTEKLLADPRWELLVRELMLEVIAAANGLGLKLPESVADRQIERTRDMGAYEASTLVDFGRGQPLELDSIFLEPLRQARAAGVATPRLAALCAVLKDLDQKRAAWIPAQPRLMGTTLLNGRHAKAYESSKFVREASGVVAIARLNVTHP